MKSQKALLFASEGGSKCRGYIGQVIYPTVTYKSFPVRLKTCKKAMETAYIHKIQNRILEKCTLDSVKGCIVWFGASSSSRGIKYGKIKLRLPREPSSKVYFVHRISLMLKERRKLFSHECVSHRCNNSLCCNVDHLVIEPILFNNQRKICFSMKKCLGHDIYPACIL